MKRSISPRCKMPRPFQSGNRSRSRDELAAVQLESKGGSVRVQPHHAGVMLVSAVVFFGA